MTTFTQDNIIYEMIDGGIRINGIENNLVDVIPPNNINDKNIIEIKEEAFKDSNITSITIPSFIKVIGTKCFYKTKNLIQVNFRENSMFGKMRDDNFNASDISSVDSDFDDSYDTHNRNRDTKNTDDMLSKMLKNREVFDNNLKSTETAGYKGVMEDQFGISKQFGKMIGNDITQKHKTQKIDSDMIKIYNKMISHDSDDE